MKNVMQYLITLALFCFVIPEFAISKSNLIEKVNVNDQDRYIQALASLVFYLQQCEEDWTEGLPAEDKISFSDDEINSLWKKAFHYLIKLSSETPNNYRQEEFENAQIKFVQAFDAIKKNDRILAQEFCKDSLSLLNSLWDQAMEFEEPTIHPDNILRRKFDPNLNNNPYISKKAKKKILPHVLPVQHRLRLFLDDLCQEHRITQDIRSFSQAGFEIIAEGPRSFIHVAKHRKMPGYLVKAYLDTDISEKRHKASWVWLVYRCVGAEKIRKIIQKRNFKFFTVPDKWIYCFPAKPSPPLDFEHIRHIALLVVTDMKLVPQKQNLKAWYHSITADHLKEFYTIITHAKGSSYRPDNIGYTEKRKFAFIDTEYPYKGPDFKRIRRHLRPEMRDYWDYLVKNGGE